MPPDFARPSRKASAPTISSLFVLTGSCKSGPGLAPPPSGFVGPSNREKVIILIHGARAGDDKSWRNPITAAYWPELIQSDPDWKGYRTYLLGKAAWIWGALSARQRPSTHWKI
jgi:hypothetical protein